jgi:hypothetical protein
MYKLPDTQIRREAFAPATETAEIRSALPASKSIQLQIAAVSSVRSLPWPSLLRGVCRSGVRLAEIGKIRAHQPLIGRHPIAEGRVRGQRQNHVHHVVAEAAAVEGGKGECGGRVQFVWKDAWAEAREELRSVGGWVGR